MSERQIDRQTDRPRQTKRERERERELSALRIRCSRLYRGSYRKFRQMFI